MVKMTLHGLLAAVPGADILHVELVVELRPTRHQTSWLATTYRAFC